MAKDITVRINADPSAFMQAIGQVNGALSKADAQARKTTSGFQAFGSSLQSVGIGLVASITAPLVGFGISAIKASADMEVLTMGLKAVMKSSQATGDEMDKLRVLARLPGIDLEGAVRGSIRLQTLGRSADSSRRIMGELANAIAIAGGGKDDFAEVTRQLVQMQSVGNVTKENLNTITERMPQVSKIMLDTWGPQSLGDPAKFFEKAGISSAQFIETLTDKLSQGARAGSTFKNSFENAMQDSNLALAEFGDALKPIAGKILDEFVTPVLGKVTELAKEFKALPDSAKNISVMAGAIAAAVPVAIVGIGTLLTNLASIKLALGGFGITATTFASAAGVITLAFKSLNEGLAIYEKLKETAYQFERLTGIVFSAQSDIHKLNVMIVSLNENFPNLTAHVSAAYRAIKNMGDAALLPGFGVFKSAIEAVNIAMAIATGRSKEMDASIASLNRRSVEQGAQNLKLAADMKNFNGAAGDLIPKLKAVADGHSAAAAEASKSIEVSHVMLDTNGKLSKESLVYVESLERVKQAIGKVKDVMYEYSVQGTPFGKAMETQRMGLDRLASASGTYADGLKRIIGEQQKLVTADEIKNMPVALGMPKLPDTWTGSDSAREMGIETESQRAKRIADLRKNADIMREANRRGDPDVSGNMVIEAEEKLRKAIEGTGAAATRSGKAQTAAMRQVSLVTNDLARGITDVIFKGGKLGDMFKSVASQAAQSITRLLIEGALTQLSKKLFEVGGIMGKVFGGAGGAGGTIFSSVAGGGASAAGSAIGGAGSAAGGVASTVGQVGGAVASAGITAIVGAVSGVVSAISGVIGNFQMAGMNKSLDLIENYTRYAKGYLGEQTQSILWSTQTTAERLLYANTSLDMIGRFQSEMLGNLQIIAAGGGTGGTVINNNMAGAFILSDSQLGEFADRLARFIKARS